MGSAVEAAASIRQALKAKRITSRQVSVIADQYSMGSAIRIKIKDANIPKKLVEEIASPHERVDRDQFGDILSGGNRFVDVEYTEEAIAPIAKEVFALLEPLGLGDGVEYKGTAQSGHCVTVRLARPTNTGYPEGAIYTARSDGWAQGVEVFSHGKTGCARQVAVILLNGGAR